MKQKKLFLTAEPREYSLLIWQVFMSFLGSKDCAELSLQDRNLVIEFYKYIDSWLNKECIKADNK